MKKILGILLCLSMLLCFMPTAAFAAEGEAAPVSKSKIALANLDSRYETDIRLSLPAKDTPLVSDVVFVLDKSTSMKTAEEMITPMLTELEEQVKETEAKVKVGLIIFDKIANVALPLTELNDENKTTVENALEMKYGGGTNLHAGLVAAKKMLDADESVRADRKYLVLVTDGITYLYCDGNNYETPLSRSFGDCKGALAELQEQQNRPNDYNEIRGEGNYLPAAKNFNESFNWENYLKYLDSAADDPE